jgi:hypothetical protein
MKKISYSLLTLTSVLLAATNQIQAQTTIADWSFDAGGKIVAPYNSPSATSGANGGTASVLGMNNSYDGVSVSYADVTKEVGASVPGTSYAWRIRGGSSAGGAGSPNGWSTNAPIATQGAEFAASTAGFNNIKVSFDAYVTTTGEANMAVEYTTDGSSWNVATISYSGAFATVLNNTTDPNLVTGNYLQVTAGDGNNWLNGISIDLSGISGANNNSNFAIEIVNAATGVDNIQAAGTPLSPTSGNWQFDNVLITGVSSVPEPSTIALASIGIAGLLALRRNRKN